MSEADYVERVALLQYLTDNPDGVTVREVADTFDTSHMEAQNALRRLYMDNEVTTTKRTKIQENKRWVIADDD